MDEVLKLAFVKNPFEPVRKSSSENGKKAVTREKGSDGKRPMKKKKTTKKTKTT
jgi:hypothetical protein